MNICVNEARITGVGVGVEIGDGIGVGFGVVKTLPTEIDSGAGATKGLKITLVAVSI